MSSSQLTNSIIFQTDFFEIYRERSQWIHGGYRQISPIASRSQARVAAMAPTSGSIVSTSVPATSLPLGVSSTTTSRTRLGDPVGNDDRSRSGMSLEVSQPLSLGWPMDENEGRVFEFLKMSQCFNMFQTCSKFVAMAQLSMLYSHSFMVPSSRVGMRIV